MQGTTLVETEREAAAADRGFAEDYFREMREVLSRVDAAPVAASIRVLLGAWRRGSKVFIAGNGGSASTASHMVCDLAKCTAVEGRARFRVLGLNDSAPLLSALTNDEGWGRVYSEQLAAWFDPGDVLVLFSVHGGSGSDKAGPWSQNLLAALRLAHERGGEVVGFAGFDGGAMRELCDVCVVVPVESTPHVESIHLALEHLVTARLRRLIEAGG
ncbi:MAG: SIS domain-containing protein [Planctomycetes bacterium]|nr:SIS domain-containing protein [Planctomycetota bacterium]